MVSDAWTGSKKAIEQRGSASNEATQKSSENSLAVALSPKALYELAQKNEAKAGDEFLGKLTAIYENAKTGIIPANKSKIIQEFVVQVDALIKQGKQQDQAIKAAHVALTASDKNIVVLDPEAGHFNKRRKNYLYGKFYDTLATAIPDTQLEPKDALEELLKAGYMGVDGRKELGLIALCPLTDMPVFAANFYVNPYQNAAWYIYGGVNPEVRGWGYQEHLIGAMKHKTLSEAQGVSANARKAETAIFFEMDNPTAMSAQDIFYDVTRLETDPKPGESLKKGAIDPYLRGDKYKGGNENARLLQFVYRQSSLFGTITATDIAAVDPSKGAADLAVKFLAEELKDPAQIERAEAILGKVEAKKRAEAVEEIYAEIRKENPKLSEQAARRQAESDAEFDMGSTILRLAVFTQDGTIGKARLIEQIKTFFADSVLKTPDMRNVEQDIYFQAMLRSLNNIKGDTVNLESMNTLIIPPAKNLAQMTQLVPTVLESFSSVEDLNGARGVKPLGDLLAEEPHHLVKFAATLQGFSGVSPASRPTDTAAHPKPPEARS